VKQCAIFLILISLVSCVGTKESLVVKQFQLRDQLRDNGEEPMVRMEKEHRLRGAVSMEERRQRLGQYYTLMWNDPSGVNSGPVELVFEYRQGKSASQIKRFSKQFPASAASGVAEFSVIGDNYFNNGKVLAWRSTVLRDGKEIAVRRSYLWN
jgi:hypothetical protein